MIRRQITVGCDPECFLKDIKTGAFVASDVPGTKDEPFKVLKGALQTDGAAAEFNIDPARNAEEFITNIDQVLTQLRAHIPGKELVFEPTCTFEPTYFDSLPDMAKDLGCNPDWNAWTGEVNPKPDPSGSSMRTASGHIHLGWLEKKSYANPMDPNHLKDCQLVIKEMDYYLGIYSLLWDPAPERRLLYGKAGAFRPKPYGCEYRTMSNSWLKSMDIQAWIFNQAVSCINNLLSDVPRVQDKFGDLARTWIDTNKIDWLTTKEGVEIQKMIGCYPPDLTEINNYGKPKAEYERKKTSRKRTPKKFFDMEAAAPNLLAEWPNPLAPEDNRIEEILANAGRA